MVRAVRTTILVALAAQTTCSKASRGADKSTCAAATVPPPSTVAELHEALRREKFAFVPGATLWDMLASRGANSADVPTLASYWDEAIPQFDERGRDVYPFKGTLVSYYQMDASLAEGFNVERSQRLSEGEALTVAKARGSRAGRSGFTIEHIDPTTSHGDVSYFRVHKAWPASADSSSVVRALHELIFDLLGRGGGAAWTIPAPGTNGSSPVWLSMMSGFRVAQVPGAWGEPGPEGVHQDACELTAVVLLNRDGNVAPGTGSTRVWSLAQPSGKSAAAPTGGGGGGSGSGDSSGMSHLIGEGLLSARFDALFLLDREVKHEALPFLALDPNQPATRDVLTFEVRRPRLL